MFELTVPYILSASKAEEEGVAVATPTDENAADGRIDGDVSMNMNVSLH